MSMSQQSGGLGIVESIIRLQHAFMAAGLKPPLALLLETRVDVNEFIRAARIEMMQPVIHRVTEHDRCVSIHGMRVVTNDQ